MQLSVCPAGWFLLAQIPRTAQQHGVGSGGTVSSGDCRAVNSPIGLAVPLEKAISSSRSVADMTNVNLVGQKCMGYFLTFSESGSLI